MLKIGTVKWHGKCPHHPTFNPLSDGPAAIKGGCPRCQDLQAIFESNQKTLRLMRAFAPPAEPRKRSGGLRERQQDLFSSNA